MVRAQELDDQFQRKLLIPSRLVVDRIDGGEMWTMVTAEIDPFELVRTQKTTMMLVTFAAMKLKYVGNEVGITTVGRLIGTHVRN